MRPRDTLDLGLILLGLLFTTAAISTMDLLEAGMVADRTVSLMPWAASEHGGTALDRDYLVIRNSIRRWLVLYLPALSLLAGAGVGVACSSVRRAWALGAAASLSVATTGAALVLASGAAALLAMTGLAGLGSLSATGTALAAQRLRRTR